VERRGRFWWAWLIVVTIGVEALGLVLVLAPAVGRRVFGLLIFGSSTGIEELGAAATPYITLAHGVLGAVMLGWGAALLFIVLGPFRRGSRESWFTLAVSVTAWFIADTAFSVWTGYWQNAALNVVIGALFAIPLAATYRSFRRRKTR
jgi:hypothetical protein